MDSPPRISRKFRLVATVVMFVPACVTTAAALHTTFHPEAGDSSMMWRIAALCEGVLALLWRVPVESPSHSH